MKAKDEELQNQIEKAISSDDGVDAYSYKIVFDTLRKEPDSYLSTNFADRVVQKIETRNESTNDFIWFGVGMFTFAVAAVVAIVLTDFKVSFGALKFLASYPGLFVFGIGFILALNWLDKKLVRPKTSI